MPHRSPLHRLLAVLTATAAGSVAVMTGGAASAAGVVEVAGTSFPGGTANFAHVSCSGLTAAGGAAPSAVVREIPGTRYGTRSTGFTATGAGAGPKAAVPSVRGLTRLSVDSWSDEGAAGQAYVWLFPTVGDVAWLGRASVGSSESFATQDVARATFTWEARDRDDFSATGEPARELTIAQATRPSALGNGPGHVGFAYGCDGADFSLDGFRVGGAASTTTYDFEGIDVTTSIRAARLDAGPGTTLVGSSSGAGENTGEPLVLQKKVPGARAFSEAVGVRVAVDAAGVHTAVVRPARATQFRWSRQEVPYADAGTSAPYEVAGRLKSGEIVEPARPPRSRPAPADPTTPVEPGAPTEPTTPPTPSEPAAPADPSTPAAPTEPAAPADPSTPAAPTEPEPEPEPEPTPTAPDPTATDPDAAVVAACQVALDETLGTDATAVLTEDELAAITVGEDATEGTVDDCLWDPADDWLSEQGLRESAG